ncbi:hypothetical protein CONPUDRAFT_76994 [Coniophora puteana RWD-64-598 SS2]|uniref:Uncharacterized protein n=1 Tax=Coniophora puteana (strain RWD-64-598) TaxID=741705 RepID=A0A5M3MBE4_CONPW|nr:uncharacterized protein CONPUDRAFT_76994 [Coniophora puteana RWD-64-598 SS2]EIW75955.1 hypothetical protein CONPUDRAFT_76994 [Coniophora puteana RWD-64-598 SS2]
MSSILVENGSDLWSVYTLDRVGLGQLRYVGLLWGIRNQRVNLRTNVSSMKSSHTWSLVSSSGIGYILTDVRLVIGPFILFVLQGMMALRVYVLLEKSKRVLAVLVIGFLAAQAVTFSIVISEMLLVRGGSIVTPAKAAIMDVSQTFRWLHRIVHYKTESDILYNLTMIGPWMFLGLRKQSEKATESHNLGSGNGTTLHFADINTAGDDRA